MPRLEHRREHVGFEITLHVGREIIGHAGLARSRFAVETDDVPARRIDIKNPAVESRHADEVGAVFHQGNELLPIHFAFALRFLGANAFDGIDRMARVQVEHAQLVFLGPVRLTAMRRQHAQNIAAPADERHGEHGAITRPSRGGAIRPARNRRETPR